MVILQRPAMKLPANGSVRNRSTEHAVCIPVTTLDHPTTRMEAGKAVFPSCEQANAGAEMGERRQGVPFRPEFNRAVGTRQPTLEDRRAAACHPREGLRPPGATTCGACSRAGVAPLTRRPVHPRADGRGRADGNALRQPRHDHRRWLQQVIHRLIASFRFAFADRIPIALPDLRLSRHRSASNRAKVGLALRPTTCEQTSEAPLHPCPA